MQDKRKTKAQLIAELTELRQEYETVQQELAEYKRTSETLKESEKIFRELFENSPDAIFVEDYEGNVLDANSEACRLNGMAYEELVGSNVLNLVPEEEREAVTTGFAQLVAGEMNYVGRTDCGVIRNKYNP